MIHPWNKLSTCPINSQFIFPQYDGLSLANIPGTILENFGAKSPNPSLKNEISKKIYGSEKIILLLIDGLGYVSWKKHCRKISKEIEVFPLTSVFPSTTPAAITTVNSGLLPSEHGLPEWFIYLKEIDNIIESLPFTPLGEKGPDYLAHHGYSPKLLFNKQTVYEKLAEKRIKSYTFMHNYYADSAYNKVALKKSIIIPYKESSDLIKSLVSCLKKERGKAYFYIYYDKVDSISHRFGPSSKRYKDAVKEVINNVVKRIMKECSFSQKTTLLITADHGQIATNPEKTIYLNQLLKLERNLKRSKNNRKILPWGNARDVFLDIKKDKLKETFTYLSSALKGKATVFKISDAISYGLFGKSVLSQRFIDRIGDILILPDKKNTVWYKYSKDYEYSMLGHHGGLSKEEMLIPFGIFKLPF